jgi:glutathione S-transferase
MFTKQKFLLGDEFSMLDVAIAPCCGVSTTTASSCRVPPHR